MACEEDLLVLAMGVERRGLGTRVDADPVHDADPSGGLAQVPPGETDPPLLVVVLLDLVPVGDVG